MKQVPSLGVSSPDLGRQHARGPFLCARSGLQLPRGLRPAAPLLRVACPRYQRAILGACGGASLAPRRLAERLLPGRCRFPRVNAALAESKMLQRMPKSECGSRSKPLNLPARMLKSSSIKR
jgi:hypothetical protein